MKLLFINENLVYKKILSMPIYYFAFLLFGSRKKRELFAGLSMIDEEWV